MFSDVDFYGGYSKVKVTPIRNPKLDHESHGVLSLSLSLGPPSRGRTIKKPTETT